MGELRGTPADGRGRIMSGPRLELLRRFGTFAGGREDAEFHNPEGLSSDSSGNFYVADETNHRVQKIDPEGRMIWKVGAVDPDGRPFPGTAPGQFNMLRGVCADAEDSVLVADANNNRVQKLDSEGRFCFMFGSYGNGPGQFGGKGPNGIAVDAEGFIYVTDTHTLLGGNNRILKFDSRGRFVSAMGEYGVAPGQFAGRVPLRGRYSSAASITSVGNSPEGPYGLAIGQRSGLLYVADTECLCVKVLDPKGNFLRSIGEGILYR